MVECSASWKFSHSYQILALTFSHRLRWGLLWKLWRRLQVSPLDFTLLVTLSFSCPCGSSNHRSHPCPFPYFPHTWIFSPARKVLSTCRPSEKFQRESSTCWAVSSCPGPSAYHLPSRLWSSFPVGWIRNNCVPSLQLITCFLDHSRTNRHRLGLSGS